MAIRSFTFRRLEWRAKRSSDFFELTLALRTNAAGERWHRGSVEYCFLHDLSSTLAPLNVDVPRPVSASSHFNAVQTITTEVAINMTEKNR